MRWFLLLLPVCVFAASGCASVSRAATFPAPTSPATTLPAPTTTSPAARVTTMTTLGDSVPYGTACHCRPFPQLAAAGFARLAGQPVESYNDAVPGYRTSDVLEDLDANVAVMAHVESSDAVMIEIGANDIAYSSACGTDVACYAAKLPQVTENVDAIVARVRELTVGRRVTVFLLDYWNVWLGGQYAHARGAAYETAANDLTHRFSTVIHAVARETTSTYVDLRTAFRGPDDDHDESALLAPDGDHPNAAGQERIAEAILDAVPPA